LKRTLSLAATACLMALVARSETAADFAIGAEAYDSGDYAAAYGEWITLARDGHAGAQIAIANMYRQGEGRRPDPAEAARWYRLAARAGNQVAQINLAELYELGAGVNRNLPLAWAWYDRAAASGHQWGRKQAARLAAEMPAGALREGRRLRRLPLSRQ